MEYQIMKMPEQYEVELENVGVLILKPEKRDGTRLTIYSKSFRYNGNTYLITIERRRADDLFMGEITCNGESVVRTEYHYYTVIDGYLEREWGQYLVGMGWSEIQKARYAQKPTDRLQLKILNGSDTL